MVHFGPFLILASKMIKFLQKKNLQQKNILSSEQIRTEKRDTHRPDNIILIQCGLNYERLINNTQQWCVSL